MNVEETRRQPGESGLQQRLGIRASLLLGFGAMTGIMILSVLAALFFSSRVNIAVRGILESQLPITVHTLHVARAADALTASGLSVATLSTKADRDATFQRVNSAVEALDRALEDLEKDAGDAGMIPLNLLTTLKANLQRLQDIVDGRIRLQERQADARRLLLTNLQTFQQHLTYRTRILEGDADVISRLMAQSDPPTDEVAAIAGQLAGQLPLARFYATVESINGRLLAAGQSPTPASLNTARHELAVSLGSLRDTLKSIPGDLGRDLAHPIAELNDLILDEDGLLRLRENELLLLGEIKNLNAVNQDILEQVNAETARLVSMRQSEMNRTGASLQDMRRQSMLMLFAVAVLGLLFVAVLMHFYVNRQVITRLAWLSSAMQDVAAGRLDTNLPPAGPSELGRLGAALRQFSATAAEARVREAALQASNQRAALAMESLEAKTAELERANTMLTELSIRDSLTGLFNRRHLDEALAQEWARAGHGGKAVALIILDVDYFKAFNDLYGHPAGDECLKRLAGVFRGHARRAGDVAARYGGEEFCMVCPYTDMDMAGMLARNIHGAVSALGLLHEKSPFGIVTVSIGYAAAVPNGQCSHEGLLRAADDAMYAAKMAGRSCVRGAHHPDCGL